MLDCFEPEEILEEVESKRRLKENWDAILDAHPKYKRLANQNKD
jgi:hypothetical protein